MAIDTTIIGQGTVGPYRFILQKHTTPGTGANEIDTGAGYVIFVTGSPSGTPDKVLCLTPNTSDHSTEALGSFALECEADITCYTIALVSG